jgi:hypothetical protein
MEKPQGKWPYPCTRLMAIYGAYGEMIIYGIGSA